MGFSVGESLLTLDVSGLVAVGAVLRNGWLDPAYVGIALALVVFLLCVGQFARRRWAGLLFWSGAALGALLGQGYALWHSPDPSSFVLSTNGAIGGVLGMLAGGMLADWWQGRQAVRAVPAAPAGAAERRDLAADLRHQQVDQQLVGDGDDYPDFEAEAV